MTPLETYNALTDEELLDFVAAALPKLLWEAQRKPRSVLIRDVILDEIRKRPMFFEMREAQG